LHTHVVLPAGELACAAHIVQALDDVAFWYVSGGQSVHSEEPVASAKVPAGQSSHSSDPVEEMIFEILSKIRNLPNLHGLQLVTPSQNNPALQTHGYIPNAACTLHPSHRRAPPPPASAELPVKSFSTSFTLAALTRSPLPPSPNAAFLTKVEA